jgi:hypothetical protein
MPITEADVQEVIAPMHTKGGLIALLDSMPDDCEWVMVNRDPNILGLSGTGILNIRFCDPVILRPRQGQ